jgi:flagellar hook assembly protein FlgD
VYAFPGILTNELQETTGRVETKFAYNLASDARVTIRVFDFNMDLVKTVVKNAPRKAGSNRSTARSTQPQDVWDGTNEYGQTVAPGVYYFQIAASTGERAFGKIVVALQR